MPKAASQDVRRAARALRIDLLRKLGRVEEADRLAARPLVAPVEDVVAGSPGGAATVGALVAEVRARGRQSSGQSFRNVHSAREQFAFPNFVEFPIPRTESVRAPGLSTGGPIELAAGYQTIRPLDYLHGYAPLVIVNADDENLDDVLLRVWEARTRSARHPDVAE